MEEIEVVQMVCDVEGLTLLDSEGRVWTGYWRNATEGYVWTLVNLPKVEP